LQNSFREPRDDGCDYPAGKGEKREREREREENGRKKREKSAHCSTEPRRPEEDTQRIGRLMKIASRKAYEEEISRKSYDSLSKLPPLLLLLLQNIIADVCNISVSRDRRSTSAISTFDDTV